MMACFTITGIFLPVQRLHEIHLPENFRYKGLDKLEEFNT
jgi:hypothetical protein